MAYPCDPLYALRHLVQETETHPGFKAVAKNGMFVMVKAKDDHPANDESRAKLPLGRAGGYSQELIGVISKIKILCLD